MCSVLSCLLALQAEAKKLAFYLFYNIKGETARNHLVEEDLAPFLRPELAREAFQMLDTDGNEKVNLHVSACPPSFLVVDARYPLSTE